MLFSKEKTRAAQESLKFDSACSVQGENAEDAVCFLVENHQIEHCNARERSVGGHIRDKGLASAKRQHEKHNHSKKANPHRSQSHLGFRETAASS